MESIKKIILTVGLPGSGKTTFCKNYLKYNENIRVNHIEFDKYRITTYGKKLNFENILLNRMNEKLDEVLVIDTLLLDNNTVINAIEVLKDTLESINEIEIEIHYWNIDRDSCLHNDRGRRKEDSSITIKNANLEEINIELVKQATFLEKISLITHDVKKKSKLQLTLDFLDYDIKEVIDEYGGNEDNKRYFYSKEWLVRGTQRYYINDNWDSEYIKLDTEEAIMEFKEFDKLLEQICPTLTFIEYKELLKICVDIEEYDEDDYYTYATYKRWRCNLEILEEYLKAKNYIK